MEQVAEPKNRTAKQSMEERDFNQLTEENQALKETNVDLETQVDKLTDKLNGMDTENLRMRRRQEAIGHEKAMSIVMSEAKVPDIVMFGLWCAHDVQKMYQTIMREVSLHSRRIDEWVEENKDPDRDKMPYYNAVRIQLKIPEEPKTKTSVKKGKKNATGNGPK